MKKIGMIFLLIGLMWACSPVRVISTEPAAGFSLDQYQTFNFFEVEASGDALSPSYTQNLELIKTEVARQLEAKGLTRSTSNPDLLVNLGLMVSNEKLTRQTRFGQDGPFYMGQRRYTWKSQEVVVDKYKEGTVSVHLVDKAQNQMVWHAEAESVIPDKVDKLQQRIAEGAAKLFQSLPAKTNR